MVVPAVKDLQESASHELGVIVSLGEPAGTHAGTKPDDTRVLNRADLYIADRTMLDVRI
jgi:hypothetical protein